MTPKNPFEDPEHPIDYNIRGKDVKPKPIKKAPVKPKIIAPEYKIEFEKRAHRTIGSEKSLYYFHHSLSRLRKDGFERHAQPQEVLGLIMDGLEGKLDKGLQEIQRDMATDYAEWLSLTFERNGDNLFAHIDPEGVMIINRKYTIDNWVVVVLYKLYKLCPLTFNPIACQYALNCIFLKIQM